MPEPLRYAIYTRQSVEGARDFSSCEAQFMVCQDCAKETGEPNLKWCDRRFDDKGESGATLDRPAMRRLRKIIDLNGLDCVYAVAFDRLARNMRDAVVLLDEFDRAGVDLRLVHQPDWSSGAQQRFVRHILAAFAEFEREMIASRLKEARAYRRKHGRRLAGKVPYGYDADPITKQLVPNKAEARRVRAIFKRAAAGQWPTQIAAACNKQGWRTKVYESKRSGKVTGGGRWTARQVLAVLRNRAYIGRFAQGDTSRHGLHEAIVDEEVFASVQQVITARRPTDSRRRQKGAHFFLRQKIVCPQCGRFLTTYTSRRKVSDVSSFAYRYYACRSTAGGRPRCRGVSYPAPEVERFVEDLLSSADTWRGIVGTLPSERNIQAAIQAWSVAPPGLRHEILRQGVERVEFRRRNSEISVTFASDPWSRFLPPYGGFSGSAVNHSLHDE